MSAPTTRRSMLGAAAMAATGITPIVAEANSNRDADLIAACKLFLRRHAEQDERAERGDVTDEENSAGTEAWNDALADILTHRLPVTEPGMAILAKAARLALIDEAMPFLDEPIEEQLSMEQRVVVRALQAVEGGAA